VDAAIVGITGEPLPTRVGARVIDVEPLVLAVRPGHELARSNSVDFGRLRGYPLVTLTHGSGLRVVLERACQRAGFAPDIGAEASELSSLAQLAAEGLEFALLPGSAVAGAAASRVAVVGVTSPRLERRTALAWHEGPISPAGRALLELAHRALSKA
jgi:DNA-binding transcriptional LysR family regulator